VPKNRINNDLYDQLGYRWHLAQDDPVALLRAESELRNPWVGKVIDKHFSDRAAAQTTVLDVACGGGLLSNYLAKAGYQVTGVDLSSESLKVARDFDETRSVVYRTADAYSLPFPSASFDVVCAMDFLEHVENPAGVIAEIERVLKPGGLFFFHTFSKNPIAGLVVIKGVEWFVKNTPPRMHLYRLFIRPEVLKNMCEEQGLRCEELRGCRPVVMSRSFWKMLFTGSVPKDFKFIWTQSTLISYTGYARKEPAARKSAAELL
jgi:2-polyprenyl-6-hydroxyphenyl methylase/3-demethylubiquinone-9 3-methyltransferase